MVQIDSVNVLVRSHYLPFYSRLGPYDRADLDRLRDRAPRAMVEYWAHEASLIPPEVWPLLRFRMERADADSWSGMQRVVHDHPELVGEVLDVVRRHGPLTARRAELLLEHDAPRDRTDWGWNWSLVKNALEHLFWAGWIGSAGRTSQFERRYAALDRILAPRDRHVVETRLAHEDAFAALMERAARALGVGTERCLRDYYRLRPEQSGPALARLVDEGVLAPVTVAGWRRPAYLHREARRPRRVDARALLSPFDSLIWTRDRTAALFGFDYRLEIYVPPAQRVHGYYVLPFLLGEDLVARADLKADRAAGVLKVQQVTWEPGRGGASDRAELEAEFDLLSTWLFSSQS